MYFSRFPKSLYTFNFATETPKVVTNILSRVRFNSNIITNASVFYKYQLQETDTPEIVAFKEYGDATLHWVICLINDLKDPLFDFPLSTAALESKMLKQYNLNDISLAFSTTHHYELEVEDTLIEIGGATTVTKNTSVVTLQQYNYSSNTLTTKVQNSPETNAFPIIFRSNNSNSNSAVTAYMTKKSTYKPVSIYDHEFKENEKKRQIKILRREYIQPLKNELGTLLND
jgi:hypothetical protein